MNKEETKNEKIAHTQITKKANEKKQQHDSNTQKSRHTQTSE